MNDLISMSGKLYMAVIRVGQRAAQVPFNYVSMFDKEKLVNSSTPRRAFWFGERGRVCG